MAVIASIDGPTRRIYLSASTQNAEVQPMDIYKEMRTLRRTDESLRKFDVFLSASGNEPKGGGKFTARLVKCLLGTRIVPYDSTHELTIIGEIITDEATSGVACFDRTLLTPPNVVDINYLPPQVEVIQVSSGSGLSTEEHDKLMAIENPPSQVLNDYKADVSGLATELNATANKDEVIAEVNANEAKLDAIIATLSTLGDDITNSQVMIEVIQKLTGNKVTKVGDVITIFEDDNITPWRQYNLANGGRVLV
jgi:hypothetical protein